MKQNPYERNIPAKCDVCNSTIMINKIGNGVKCDICGWKQDVTSEEFPDRVIGPNFVSLNKAIKLYKEGKPLNPDFDDFIGMYMFYGEVEFTYKNIIYSVWGIENEGVEYASCPEDATMYKTIEEFMAKAKTFDGKLVKDIWHEIDNANWLQ